MKKFIFALFVCFLNLMPINLLGIDFDTKYSREDLVNVRIAWLGQENCIEQLRWEANTIAKDKFVQYFNGNFHVANIDANTKTIETFFDQNKSIILDDQAFNALIQDEVLYKEALCQFYFGIHT